MHRAIVIKNNRDDFIGFEKHALKLEFVVVIQLEFQKHENRIYDVHTPYESAFGKKNAGSIFINISAPYNRGTIRK